jgi:site-specific recombinase XerD
MRTPRVGLLQHRDHALIRLLYNGGLRVSEAERDEMRRREFWR